MERRPRKPGRPLGTPTGQTTARAGLDLIRAEREQFRLDVERGQYVALEKVISANHVIIAQARDAVLALPSKIKTRIPDLAPGVLVQLDVLFREHLMELADGLGRYEARASRREEGAA